MTLQEFSDKIRCTERRKANIKSDYCDWYYGDAHLFHERIRGRFHKLGLNSTPAQIFHTISKEDRSSFWSETTYSDLTLAESDAKLFNAIVQKGWYCDDDNPHWFLIFDNLDDAIRQSFNELNRCGAL